MFLVIGIVFSIGGGSLFVTHYDSLFFYSAVLLLCIVSYLWFIKHLFEKKLELLLLICVGTTMLFFSLQVGLTNHMGGGQAILYVLLVIGLYLILLIQFILTLYYLIKVRNEI